MRDRREQLGLTQKDVGAAIGVTDAAVSGWESGTSKPRSDRLRSLAEKLSVSERWLFWGEGDQNVAPIVQATYMGSDQVNHVEAIDSSSGRIVPLRELGDSKVSENVLKLSEKQRKVSTIFPCGPRSTAYTMRDRSMEPRILSGDVFVIDPDLEMVPEDLVLVRLKGSGRLALRHFSFGENGLRQLKPANLSWETLSFDSNAWDENVEVIGVLSEHTSPRRT